MPIVVATHSPWAKTTSTLQHGLVRRPFNTAWDDAPLTRPATTPLNTALVRRPGTTPLNTAGEKEVVTLLNDENCVKGVSTLKSASKRHSEMLVRPSKIFIWGA